MRLLIASLMLAATALSPALADSVKSKKAQKAQKTVGTYVVPGPAHARGFSPYSSHPSYDVYVNGEYAGSDPDPRIRWSLRREYCEQQVDGCL
jgi:hypothetical protein